MLSTEFQSQSSTSKREEVKIFLREEAKQIGQGNKLPTVLELCRLLDVAKATVNSALNELQGEGIIRRRRGSGVFVSEQIAKKCIALVFGENIFEFGNSPFYSMLLNRSRARAASHGEFFSFYLDVPTTHSDKQRFPVHHDLVDALERKRLHGVLLVSRRSLEQVSWLKAQGIPVVSLAAGNNEPNCVGPDYAQLVQLGVRSLATQGCRRIGLISALGLSGEGVLQSTVFSQTLTQLGLPECVEWKWEQSDAETKRSAPIHCTHEEQGYWALMKLLNADRHALDGVVINDDMMTRGAVAAAQKLGLALGSDLKIATHANKGSLSLRDHEPSLTLLEFDPDEIVSAMFGMLERLMSGIEISLPSLLLSPKLRYATS